MDSVSGRAQKSLEGLLPPANDRVVRNPGNKPLAGFNRAFHAAREILEKGPEFPKLKRALPFGTGLFYENTI